ncbi:MAG: glutamine-hydrolyzing carbamoyl-phosphate synthase small subunit [Saprospiraceae bacterium]|nr:glutamine-hydrolyzing carbamoyl-phosphate synthase small subunit [Saprospiraceae bacterium]
MSIAAQTNAFLLLEDGSFFEGFAAGKKGTVGGEICFNTSMTGYQEIYTDPSYYGQIMINTNVHIGNYGVVHAESESDLVQIRGLVCRNFSDHMSRPLAQDSLQSFLESNNILCIHGIDTRALVRHIRIHGAMNAVISTECDEISKLKSFLQSVPSMEGLELSSIVTTQNPYFFGDPQATYKVAVMDFGIKKSILRQLEKAGFYAQVFPAKTDFSEINKWNPDAFFFSNGPGDPMAMDYALQTVHQILELRKPVFGICLGHQLLSIAMGVPTFKMHHGHRGGNHPVLNLNTGLGEITSQNHGFSVDYDKLLSKSSEIKLTHVNLNDKSVEGIEHKTHPFFGVQYHPEAGPGPHDSRYLFGQFYNKLVNLYQPTSMTHE